MRLFQDPLVDAQIAHYEETPPREAAFGSLPEGLHPQLVARLTEIDRTDLYVHQAETVHAFLRGEDVIQTTGTNSGKSLGYQITAIHACLSEPAARALFLFPTKALAQDQHARLVEMLGKLPIRTGVFDGDTPKTRRAIIRRDAHIVLSNPDMLHVGILPGHENWVRFLRALRVIVIDEMHVYRGVFGSHVGNVLRRLLRLAEGYRSQPQILACSATIGNPAELFSALTSRKGTLIQRDGSPQGKRTFVFFNPPDLGDGRRLSANVATSEILTQLVGSGQRTLAFSRARVSAELVLRYARKRAVEVGIEPTQIESYRSGYTPKERREIETALFKGTLCGLSATNAMELGVDVGTLDAVILNGYPGTASSFWQQIGRAGRGRRDGLALFVAHDDPLEQYLVRRPDVLLNARQERVAVNPENPHILGPHLRCAAHERPLAPSELANFGTGALEVAEELDRAGELTFRGGRFLSNAMESPALSVNIRTAGSDLVRLMVGPDELGTMERGRALIQAHVGAIYLHRGASFRIAKLDLELGVAIAEPVEVNYYTQAIVQSVLTTRGQGPGALVPPGEASLCSLSVTEFVEGFRRKAFDGEATEAVELLDLPPSQYDTWGVRFDLPSLNELQDPVMQLGSVHGLEHALMAVAPFLIGTDRGDLGSAWYSVLAETMRPAVFVFDKTPGGVGLAERLFELREEWIAAAKDLVSSCDCPHGCPACLLSPRCECGNEPLDKSDALRRLGGEGQN